MSKEEQITYYLLLYDLQDLICFTALTIAILESEHLLRESPIESSWINVEKTGEKDL